MTRINNSNYTKNAKNNYSRQREIDDYCEKTNQPEFYAGQEVDKMWIYNSVHWYYIDKVRNEAGVWEFTYFNRKDSLLVTFVGFDAQKAIVRDATDDPNLSRYNEIAREEDERIYARPAKRTW